MFDHSSSWSCTQANGPKPRLLIRFPLCDYWALRGHESINYGAHSPSRIKVSKAHACLSFFLKTEIEIKKFIFRQLQYYNPSINNIYILLFIHVNAAAFAKQLSPLMVNAASTGCQFAVVNLLYNFKYPSNSTTVVRCAPYNIYHWQPIVSNIL